jgi:hypothetical protein
LLCSVSYCIRVSGPEGWSLMLAEHIGSTDDLHYCLVLFSARARNSLDSKFWRSGDVDVFQQIPQSASGDRCFISKSFDFVGVVEYLIVLLGIAPRSVVFIFFAFSLVATFSSCWSWSWFCGISGASCESSPAGTVTTILKGSSSYSESAVVPVEAAHPLALAVQWADIQCFSWLCGEYGPSKIWKYERIR